MYAGECKNQDAEITILFWNIGNRINQNVLDNERAEYGKQIVVTLSRHLSWSHFVALIPIKDDMARDFYTELCRYEKWNVRTLRKK